MGNGDDIRILNRQLWDFTFLLPLIYIELAANMHLSIVQY